MTQTQLLWDDTTLESLLTLKGKTHQSYAQLAESQFGDSGLGEPLRLALRKFRKERSGRIPAAAPSLFAPELQLEQRNTLVIADLHAPYHNKRLLDTAIRLARAANVVEVDIAGDLHDFNSLSPMSKGEPTTPYTTDID